MIEWLLLVAWWAVMGAALLAAACAGSLLRPRAWPGAGAAGLLEGIERAALGLALLSFLAALVGAAGLLRAWIVWPAALVVVALGATRMTWGEAARWLRGLPARAAAAFAGERLAAAVAALVLALLAANVLVGAMAPDYGQDTIWYHLSVPEQWILEGRLSMHTHCVPSTYMLAANVLYVYPLLLGTEIPATLLNASAILAVFALFPLAGWRVGGARAAALMALLVPLWALMHARSPVGAGNDVLTALWLALGVWQWARPIVEQRAPRADELAAGAFLWGTAIAAKILAAGFGLPFAGLLVLWLGWRHGLRLAARGAAIVAGAALLATAPWLVRGFLECGNPLLLLSRDLFPVRPEFAPVLAGSAALPNTIYPLTVDGVREALLEGLPRKVTYAGTGLDPLFFLFPAAVVAGLASRDGRWRLAGLGALGCLVGMVFLHGYNETVRYFGVSYLLALPLLARLVSIAGGALRPRLFGAFVLLLALASMGTFARRQLEWAGFPTIQWRYQPLATGPARLDWAEGTENGYVAVTFAAVQADLPPDALVLLPTSPGPRGLRRRALWSDYACPPWIESTWEGLDAAGVLAWMREAGVTHVLLHGDGHVDERLLELETGGALRRVPPPGAMTFVLWELLSE